MDSSDQGGVVGNDGNDSNAASSSSPDANDQSSASLNNSSTMGDSSSNMNADDEDKPRLVFKKSTSVASEDSQGGTYVRADGKRVRRVKRKKSKQNLAAAAAAAVSPTSDRSSASVIGMPSDEASEMGEGAKQTVAHKKGEGLTDWEALSGKDEVPSFPPPMFSNDIPKPSEQTKPNAVDEVMSAPSDEMWTAASKSSADVPPQVEAPPIKPPAVNSEKSADPAVASAVPEPHATQPTVSEVPSKQTVRAEPSESLDEFSIDLPPSESDESLPSIAPSLTASSVPPVALDSTPFIDSSFSASTAAPDAIDSIPATESAVSSSSATSSAAEQAEEAPPNLWTKTASPETSLKAPAAAIAPNRRAKHVPAPVVVMERTTTMESAMTLSPRSPQVAVPATSPFSQKSGDQNNPWTSAPSFEESLDRSQRSMFSGFSSQMGTNNDSTSLPPAVANPFEVIPEAPPPSPPAQEQEQQQPQQPDVTNSMSGEDILDDLVAAPSNDSSFDPVQLIAGAAAQALQIQNSESDRYTSQDDNETNSMPSFIETPRHAVTQTMDINVNAKQQPTEQFHDEPDETQGGPLWRAASYEAESLASKDRRKPRLPESIRAQARSRADVDSFDFDAAGGNGSGSYDRTGNMHRIDADDDAFIMNATLARKRVRVVQLLVFGLLGFLLAFLGSFYVQTTCHFANAEVSVGANGEVFDLHYGLWKYSPIDSAFQGYSYCTKYDDDYTDDAPLVSRIAGIASLLAGSYSLCIMWAYLIFGRASYKLWGYAVFMSLIAAISQGLTFMFFAGAVCQRNACTLGPGSAMGIVSTIMWVLLAYEMYYNMPTSVMMTHIDPGRNGANLMSNLEMTDFQEGARSYVRRMSSRDGAGGAGELPTLNSLQRKKGPGSVGSGMIRANSFRRKGSYKPPEYHGDSFEL